LPAIIDITNERKSFIPNGQYPTKSPQPYIYPKSQKKNPKRAQALVPRSRLPTPNLHNIIARDENLLLIQTGLDGPLLLEDDGQLLEGALARFHKEEVDDGDLERAPEDEEEVVLPADAREGDSGDKGVVEGGDVDEELNGTETSSC
jgi:hypothetical protein